MIRFRRAKLRLAKQWAAVFAVVFCAAAADESVRPPVAKVVPKTITALGETRVDNYFWLRDRDDPDVMRYLEAENRYTEAIMKPTEKLQAKLYSEILGRIKETDLNVPVKIDDYYYYTRTEKGKQYPIHCRKHKTLDAPEEIVLDSNALAQGQKYFLLGNYSVSPNHKLLAWSMNTTGDETFTICVKDLATGKSLPDQIANTYYSLEWGNDNRTFFYTTLDAAKRPYRVFRHVLGSKAADDKLVYEEKDEKFTLSAGKTKSRAYLLIECASSTTSEVHYLRADRPMGDFQVLLPRRQDVEYDVVHHGNDFFIRINDTGKNFRLVRTPVDKLTVDNWKEVIPHRETVMIQGLDAFQNHLVAFERENGLRKIRVQNLRNNEAHHVDFPEPVYTVFSAGNPDYHSKVLRFNYTSLVTPNSVFDYNMDDRTRDLRKQYEVLGGYDPARYQSERVFATAADGVKVPISLVYKKGLAMDGKAPMFLYGYGSYGSSSEPTFNSSRLSLLDRGFIYAIAHVRGGGEMGKAWHDAGKLLQKKNTFTDFIACAEYLVARKYTSSDRLVISGGSAGGLLMGAVVNLRPDLFRIVIAKVPFVDVLNTAQDPTLPLTVGEYEEWGNSNEKPYFDYIRSYSPYDNVKPRNYPVMLVTAGLNDPRVSYWEPAKWTAKLRATKTDSNLLLLKTNLGSGHFGPSGRYEQIKETAFDFAFLLYQLGREE